MECDRNYKLRTCRTSKTSMLSMRKENHSVYSLCGETQVVNNVDILIRSYSGSGLVSSYA